jgi:DNA-binding NarL/FixJ family response regulator
MINIAIVEDDKEMATLMLDLIKTTSDMNCVAAYDNAEALMKEFKGINTDVILMDISLPGMTGIQCVSQLKPIKPEVQFLMCTSHNEAEKTFDSLCAGATGYILKNSSPEIFLSSIRDIHKGGSPMSAEIARLVVNSFPNKSKNAQLLETLTSREQEVLYALAKGYQYKEIADQLFISIETVRTYLRKIYEKLQVHSKVEALNKVFPKDINH